MKILNWLLSPSKRWLKIEEIWKNRPKTVKISVSFENGVTKSLEGDSAQEYCKLQFFSNQGSQYSLRMLKETKWDWKKE